MEKIDRIVQNTLIFWSGFCVGWLIFGDIKFLQILGYEIIGMTFIIFCGWGTLLIMREINEHKR